MPDKQCMQCGELVPAAANFCPSCGTTTFRELPPGLASRLSSSAAVSADAAVQLGIGRVIALSILSFGLYLFWWLYMTWKQLASETGEEHFPIWHALSLFVPIYGLFRIHRHMSIIKDLAVRAGLDTSLSPGIVVVLAVLSGGLDGVSINITDVGALVTLGIISVALSTTIVAWAQSTLNRYWIVRRGDSLREARLGVGEAILTIFGLFGWAGTLFPVE